MLSRSTGVVAGHDRHRAREPATCSPSAGRAAATRHVRTASSCPRVRRWRICAFCCCHATWVHVYHVGPITREGRDMSKSVVRRVGIIGLGKMGHPVPLARHLRKAGFDVIAYDIDARARSEAQRAGIGIAAHPAAVAQQSDFVIVVVGFDKEAEAAPARSRRHHRRRAFRIDVVGIASTVAPRTMQRLAGRSHQYRHCPALHADHARRARGRGGPQTPW